MTEEAPPRRFLIATATTQYPNCPGWDRPGLGAARDEVIDLFTGKLGYELVDGLALNHDKAELTAKLRAFCCREDLTPEDMLVVYIGGHGDVLESSGEHILQTTDTDPGDLDIALTTAELAKTLLQGKKVKVRRVLLLIDTCYSGHGGGELIAQAVTRTATTWARDVGAALGVITSAQPTQEARTGAFPTLLRAAVEHLASTGYEGPAFHPDAVVDAMNTSVSGRSSHQVISASWLHLTGVVPPFLPVFDGRTVPPDDVLDDPAFRTVADNYLRWAANEWRYIQLGDLGLEEGAEENRVRRLTLSKMYMSLEADPRSLRDRARAVESRAMDAAETDADTARVLYGRDRIRSIVNEGPQRATGSAAPDSVSLEAAFDDNQVMVVLGHPGSGKTVMCQWLGAQLARTSRELLRGDGIDDLRIPLRFRVADYAAYNAAHFAVRENPEDLPTFLADQLSEDALAVIGYARTTLRALFATALADGRAVLLIDGLDELTHHRTEVVAAVTGLVRDHVIGARSAKMVLTSRVAGYDDVHLTTGDTAHFVIRPLSDGQIDEFVSKFLTEIRAADQIGAFTRILQFGNPAIRRLARTPLLLTSMCSYWHRHHNLPSTRSALYRSLLLDTAYRWRGVSGGSDLDEVFSDEERFLAMLGKVAVRLHEDHVDGRMREDELLDILDEAVLGQDRLTGSGTRYAAPLLVDRIREKVGVLAEFATGEFGFIHQTFREYLTGLTLLEPRDTLFEQLSDVIGDPRWQEPVLLALGECDSDTRAELIRTAAAVELQDPERWARIFVVAQLESPPGAQEATDLLVLLARTYEAMRSNNDSFYDLDETVADLRVHVGTKTFDEIAVAVIDRRPWTVGSLAALFERREWLGGTVLAGLAAHAGHDSPEWGWPVQRILRRAAGVVPEWPVEVLENLHVPNDDGSPESRSNRRTVELGLASWRRERRRVEEAVVDRYEPVIAAALGADIGRWMRCIADERVASALVVLFGGLNHQDTLPWLVEYNDLAGMLNLGKSQRAAELERRAPELVPRFGGDDVIYTIAVHLDKNLPLADEGKPAPTFDPEWMARPSTNAVRMAVHTWIMDGQEDAEALGEALRRIAASSPDDLDRAEAELGLLAFDGTGMTVRPASVYVLDRALESTLDALIRSHNIWSTWIWSPDTEITDAERAALHLTQLRLLHLAGVWPALVTTQRGGVGHDVRMATWLAELITGHHHLESTPAEAPGNPDSVLAWFTVLPGVSPVKPTLWQQEAVTPAGDGQAAIAPLRRLMRGWLHGRNPDQVALKAAFAPGTGKPGGSGEALTFGEVLDRLATEPDEGVRAEGFARTQLRGPLDEDVLSRVREDASAISSPVLRAYAVGDTAGVVDAMIDVAGASAPQALSLSLRMVTRLLVELDRLAPASQRGVVRGGQRPGPFTIVDDTVLDVVERHATDEPGLAAAAIVLKSGIDSTVVPRLASLVARAPENTGWARMSRDMLVLQAVPDGTWDADTGLKLVELASTADATTAARAQLELLGPLLSVERPFRQHQLSVHGVDALWSMAVALCGEEPSARKELLLRALTEWDIDDPDAVREMLARAEQEPAALLHVVRWTTLWREEAQLELVEWIDSITDRETAALVGTGIASQLSVTPDLRVELIDAILRLIERTGALVPFIPDLAGDPWRLRAAGHVASACAAALAAGQGAAEAARLHAETTVSVPRNANDLAALGVLAFSPLGAMPEDVVHLVPDDVDEDAMTGLLVEWLWSCETEPWSLLGEATREAVMNLLVVLSERNPAEFRLKAEPERTQPFLAALVLDGYPLTGIAALRLMSRLRYVDLEPKTGPGLAEVIEAAVLRGQRMNQEAVRFLREVRHVRGSSPGRALLSRFESTWNENVAQSLAGLVMAYTESLTCTAADQREIRAAIDAHSLTDQWRRAVHLVGRGSEDDPVELAVGPDRRTELRRLLRN